VPGAGVEILFRNILSGLLPLPLDLNKGLEDGDLGVKSRDFRVILFKKKIEDKGIE